MYIAYKICCCVFQTNQVVDLIRLLLGYIALQLTRKLPFLWDGRLLSKLPKHLHPHRHPQGVWDVSKHVNTYSFMTEGITIHSPAILRQPCRIHRSWRSGPYIQFQHRTVGVAGWAAFGNPGTQWTFNIWIYSYLMGY